MQVIVGGPKELRPCSASNGEQEKRVLGLANFAQR
jgi:hypothetical protein